MREREEAASARIDLAKALLRLEAMPRLEADLKSLRDELKSERQERTAASQLAAVLEAKLEAARERAVQAEAVGADLRAAAGGGATTRRETARIDGAERRRPSQPKKLKASLAVPPDQLKNPLMSFFLLKNALI
jgi:hypothetical protein